MVGGAAKLVTRGRSRSPAAYCIRIEIREHVVVGSVDSHSVANVNLARLPSGSIALEGSKDLVTILGDSNHFLGLIVWVSYFASGIGLRV